MRYKLYIVQDSLEPFNDTRHLLEIEIPETEAGDFANLDEADAFIRKYSFLYWDKKIVALPYWMPEKPREELLPV